VRRVVVALLVACAALVGVSSAFAGVPPTLTPGVLTVGLNMPSPGFEVGSVKGHDVFFERGFEIDVARAIAASIGIKTVAFYQESQFNRLIAGGPKPWDIALAEVTITPDRATRLTFSIPYVDADQGVLVRRSLAPLPKTIADLAKLKLCTQVNTTAADVVANTIAPTRPAKLYGNVTRLLDVLQAGTCDAVVYDAPILATLRAQVPERYGPLIGVIATHEQYGVVMAKGSPLEPAVNAAISNLIANGRLAVISKRWLSMDISKLPVLS
jgi:polar amino acid transport system substrate-binding protein